jgi:hypothetical protein
MVLKYVPLKIIDILCMFTNDNNNNNNIFSSPKNPNLVIFPDMRSPDRCVFARCILNFGCTFPKILSAKNFQNFPKLISSFLER